jgi:hypothetical protein
LIQIDLFDVAGLVPHARAMSGILSIAVAGLQAASSRLSVHAANIANQQTEGYRPLRPVQTTGSSGEPVLQVERAPVSDAQQRVPGTDFVVPGKSLEGEMVGSLESATAYKASAKLVKTAEELDKALLDILS